ncbi:MAG: polyamine aminopropyltransferase, partial [Wenzhouxiangellaceae bacterium]
MSPSNETWFNEICTEAGSAVGWIVDGHLAHAETEFQTIDVYQTRHWGKLMVIDGFVMLT